MQIFHLCFSAPESEIQFLLSSCKIKPESSGNSPNGSLISMFVDPSRFPIPKMFKVAIAFDTAKSLALFLSH